MRPAPPSLGSNQSTRSAVNGRHAVVIASGLVSVDVFRVRNTYDVLIAKYASSQPAEGQRGRVEARVLFRGRRGICRWT